MPPAPGLNDAMSDVLSLVRMRGELVCAGEFTAPWSLAFSRPAAHFHIVDSGAAWLVVDGVAPVRLAAGDLAIVPLGDGHSLANDHGVDPIPIEKAIADGVPDGGVWRWGGQGGEAEELTRVVCCRFTFAGVLAARMITVPPPLIHIQGRRGGPLSRPACR